MWEPYIYYEGVELVNAIHTHPPILILRPRVTTYHGIDISTRPNSTIVLDPPLHQIASLKIWSQENISYIHRVINERLYEKDKQKTVAPANTEVRLIGQIVASSNPIKNFWIRGKIRIINCNQRFFSAICTSCNKITGAPMDMEFDCNFCGLRDIKPKPKARFQAHIYDDTGFIDATIEDLNAETSLISPPLKYMKSIYRINEKLQNQNFLCEMRSYLPSQKHLLPLFFLTTFIPEEPEQHPQTHQIAEIQSSELVATPPSFLKDSTTENVASIEEVSPSLIPTSTLSVVSTDQGSHKGPSSSVKRSLEEELTKTTKHPKLD
ncbi:uncharacterized protein [Coffea arabica]|uniref:Replication factor A C-terminal domain-containing protein n=1 Tax=Coffea arabica TaxID=13443 RepID=A0ABM4X4Z3_COFAR